MALRLYRTTRPLFGQVLLALQTMGVPTAVGGNPTLLGLIALHLKALDLRLQVTCCGSRRPCALSVRTPAHQSEGAEQP